MRTLIVLGCALFAGCAISPTQLEPPAAILMKPPAKLAELKAGDDLVQKHADLRRSYSTETGKYARLQKYVRTIVKQ